MSYTATHPTGAWTFDVIDATNDGKLDGDTCRIVADLGFGSRFEFELRLMDCYAPELSENGGYEAKDALAKLLTRRPMTVTTYRRQSGTDVRSFVRWVGRLTMYLTDGAVDVSEWLVANGYANATSS